MSRTLVAACALALLAFTGGSVAAGELTRAEVETIIREYLKENPNVIYESVEKHQQELARQEEEQQRSALAANYTSLVADAPTVGSGAPEAITIVEFFDYNCGYCKRSMNAILKVLDSATDVRFVFIEYPILAPSSKTAAQAALAAARQDRYFEFHRALMAHRGALTDSRVMEIAVELSLDLDQLERDMQDEAIQAALEHNAAVGEAMGVQGTPFFLVNQKAYPGWLDEETLRAAITEARAG